MTGLLKLGWAPDPVEPVEIPFGEWLPDLSELNNPGAVEALNVLPTDGGYSPVPSLVPLQATPETVRGAISVLLPTDVVQLYAGTTGGIYTKFGGAAFQKILDAPSAESNSWKFIRVNEQMVGIHTEYFPVRTPVGTDDEPVVLGGNPPRASCGAQVGDFLVLGNLKVDLDDSGGLFPSRIRWSAFNNIDLPWISDPITQADFQDMPTEGGPVVAISGREYGTVFQARMISRMTYRGPPNIFDIQTMEDKRGAIARDCVVDIGPYQYFIAEDGFFVWNGVNSQPIGDLKVNRYFFNRLYYGHRSRIVGAVDFANGCVHWAFPTSTSGILDEIITYSYRENRFTHTQVDLEYLFSSAVSNLSVEELDQPAESYDISFDDPSFNAGGRSRLAAFNTDHYYGLFNGPSMAATIDTGEYSGPRGRRVFVNNARPMVDIVSPNIYIQAAMRDQLIGEPIVFGDPVFQEIDGQCPIMADARYMRFRTLVPAAIPWKHATGIAISRKATGNF